MSGTLVQVGRGRRCWRASLLSVIVGLTSFVAPMGARAVGAPSEETPVEPIFPTVEYPGPGQVMLTFDDGPYVKTTSAVLDILERFGVGATFFVVGYMANRSTNSRAVLARAAAAGHSIQNHSWDHPHLAGLAPDLAQRELDRTNKLIKRLTGIAPTIFRPPFGSTSPRVRAVAASLGLRQMMWGASPRSMNATADEMVSTILGQARRYQRAGRGLVILLHDGSGNRAGTVKALPDIIRGLKRAGWEFVIAR